MSRFRHCVLALARDGCCACQDPSLKLFRIPFELHAHINYFFQRRSRQHAHLFGHGIFRSSISLRKWLPPEAEHFSSTMSPTVRQDPLICSICFERADPERQSSAS